MAAQPARVALIGYGPGGAVFHAPYIAATPGLKLAAIVTANPQRRAQAKHEFPGTALLRSPDEIWVTAGDFDLVVVATPNVSHVPLALDALEAGLAVVVDKPLAPSVAEARRLVAAAQEHELLLTVFHNRRWDGDFLAPNAWQRFYEGVAVSLRDGSPPPVDPVDAVATLEVLEAARASARDKAVTFP
jgi:scyllo-inositol 2-dehydrogenase (NADP+)